jgi:oligopeptidase A
MDNPLLQLSAKKLPPFDEIKPDHIQPAVSCIINENKQKIAELLQQPHFTWENLIQPFEELDDRLDYVWSVVTHLNAVANSEPLRNAYNVCLPKITGYATEIAQNLQLYAAIKTLLVDSQQNLDAIQTKILKEELRDFHLSGADLPPDQKQRFAQLETCLSALTNKFEENLLDATQGWSRLIVDPKDLAGIPSTAIQAAFETAQQKKLQGWFFTLEAPSYLAVVSYADSRSLRQEIYTAYCTRASDAGPNAKRWDNTPVMQEILEIRYEMAKLLGFENYAELSLATKTAKNTQEVIDFLDALATYALPIAQREFSELSQFGKEHFGIDQIQAWDVSYLAEKLRQHRFAISEEQLRPYFPIDQVLFGLFHIVKRLFNIHIREKKDITTWNPDVKFFEIYDEKQELLGQFYLDLYARENKRSGAWMDECRVRRRLTSNQIQTPVAFLTCNFSPPVGKDPALLTHDDVLTLFHEFGHGLHQLLSKVDYADATGTQNVPWDVVEFPSQFLENWCWEEPALELIGKHYQTGQSISPDLVRKLRATRNFHAGMQTLRQLEFALFDFRLHMEFTPQQEQQITRILQEVRAKLMLYPIPSFNRFEHSFTHIFASSYAAGYYSYKWAEVWASDAFSQFEKKGIFDEKTGKAFLEKILAKGSSEDPLQMFIDFQGRPPQINALLTHMGGIVTTEVMEGDTGISNA